MGPGEDVFPFIFASLLFVVVPMVFMLLKHQQKMTAIIHNNNRQLPQTPVHDPMVINELARLRDVVAQQNIALDNLTTSHQRLEAMLADRSDLRRRLEADPHNSQADSAHA
jgi:hypothetical protein